MIWITQKTIKKIELSLSFDNSLNKKAKVNKKLKKFII
jgi:hypothetical protein